MPAPDAIGGTVQNATPLILSRTFVAFSSVVAFFSRRSVDSEQKTFNPFSSSRGTMENCNVETPSYFLEQVTLADLVVGHSGVVKCNRETGSHIPSCKSPKEFVQQEPAFSCWAGGTAATTAVNTFNDLVTFKLRLRHATNTGSREVVIARLYTAKTAELLVPGLFPFCDKIFVGVLFPQTILI